MRLEHFETLCPICPSCKAERRVAAPLALAHVACREDDAIVEGALSCAQDGCGLEFPIVDGIPILLPQPRKYITDNFFHISARADFSASLESLLGDAAGPGSDFNTTRHHWSSYGWDHYGDRAPRGALPGGAGAADSSVARLLDAGLALLPTTPQPPALDVGCAVGRTTFELAGKLGGLVLGVDVNFWMLRVAQRVLRAGHVRFPLKRSGIRFDRVEFETTFNGAARVDFWACDAAALPFADQTFRSAVALNVFDVTPAPRALLAGLRDTLCPGGAAVFSSPYDWSPPVPVAQWIAATGRAGGGAEPPLRTMLTPGRHPQSLDGLAIHGEIEHHPWSVRVHDRRTAGYDAHVVACIRS
jgi:SAM-dependent methyltransferase/uncharacterized protein YbaR (Trm112 family)